MRQNFADTDISYCTCWTIQVSNLKDTILNCRCLQIQCQNISNSLKNNYCTEDVAKVYLEIKSQ